MEDVYSIRFYKNNKEIDFEELPMEHINGLYKICLDEINSNLRYERVMTRLVNNIKEKEVE